MTDYLDKMNFEELDKLNPDELCARALCSYDSNLKEYTISVWDEQFVVSTLLNRISRVSGSNPEPHKFMYVFILNYLLQVKDLEPTGEWISEKDLVGGPTFFRGPHEIPTQYIANRFQGDIETFRQTCRMLGGSDLDMADAAFTFAITPRVPVGVLFWAQDDEFPAEVKIIYDRTIGDHFALDVIYALAVDICARLSGVDPFYSEIS